MQQKKNNYKLKAIIGRAGIDNSPKDVSQSSRIGDIKLDSVIFRNHKSALLIKTDRDTLVTMIEKFSGKNADEVYLNMNERRINFSSARIK